MMHNGRIAGSPTVDLKAADNFLRTLDPQAVDFTFTTYDDITLPNGRKRRARTLTNNLIHGPLSEVADRLRRLNARGAGVFIIMNAGDGLGRADAHVTGVRCVYQDDDTGAARDYPLPPSLIVETSPVRFQRCWLCNGLTFEDYRTIERCLVRHHGHDPNATGLSRVVRLPGLLHMKRTPIWCA
jgi:hypothetical protein